MLRFISLACIFSSASKRAFSSAFTFVQANPPAMLRPISRLTTAPQAKQFQRSLSIACPPGQGSIAADAVGVGVGPPVLNCTQDDAGQAVGIRKVEPDCERLKGEEIDQYVVKK